MELTTLVDWLKYGLVAAPLVGASATVIMYAEDLRGSLADIRKEQGEIRQTQHTIVGRFDKIEAGHDRLDDTIEDTGKAILGSMVTLGVEVGKVSGRQEKR